MKEAEKKGAVGIRPSEQVLRYLYICALDGKAPVDGKLYEVKPGFYFCIYVSNELISALAREFGHCCNDLFLSELVIYKHKSCKCRFIISFCFFN